MIRVVASGYNCQQCVSKCIDSVIAQTYKEWKLYLIDDGSTDDTRLEIINHDDTRISCYSFGKNLGAAYRRHQIIDTFNGNDIVLLLGLDDELLPNCLERVMEEYDNGKWMTYANWKDQHGNGLPASFELDFDDETHANRDYRKVVYRSTAPNTFYAKLFHKIPKEDFIIDGEWIKATTESEVMFSCLEMCGKDRIGCIKEPIYIYNKGRTDNARRRFGDNYQDNIYKTVISRPKKDLYER